MKTIRLGLYNFSKHPWRSVERTRRFYLDALKPAFELVRITRTGRTRGVDAVLSFGGDACFAALEPGSVPHLFAVHGGAILSHARLREHASRLRSCDTLIVNCRSDQRLLRRLFAAAAPHLCRLPLPVGPALGARVDKARARACMPFSSPPDLVIGFVARLLPQKNFHHFLHMFAELAQRLAPRRIDALVVGEYWVDYPVLPYVTRDYREYVVRAAAALGVADRIVYLGANLRETDLRLAYAAMDVLVHPTCSLDENFGYVPVEAMASGVPVVGAAYGGLKDTIIDGSTGFVMPTWTTASGLRMDLIAGVDAVARLLTDRELHATMSLAARTHTAAHYSAKVCGAKLVAAVRRVVEGREAVAASEPATSRRASAAGGFLPPLERGWEYYWPLVADYASGPPPVIGDETRLRLASALQDDAGAVRLDDPAWPARFELSAEERRACDACRRPIAARDVAAPRHVLSGLLDKGLLLASNAVSAASRSGLEMVMT